MSKTATIILNRNLPFVTEKLYQCIYNSSKDVTDIFVVEAGSDQNKLSSFSTWWANWDGAMKQGLRTPRGFNYGLSELWKEGKFNDYNYFLLVTNDIEFEDKPIVNILMEEMKLHHHVGILSPCSQYWGEAKLIRPGDTKYFWYVLNGALMLRRDFIESIMEVDQPSYMNFIYDGTNFQGYGADIELVAKGYANDWATAITTKIWAEENQSHLKTKADLIKTLSYEELIPKYVEEGRKWMHKKYGYNSKWDMMRYAKFLYDQFFENFKELEKYRY